jgi:hypothetical protein
VEKYGFTDSDVVGDLLDAHCKASEGLFSPAPREETKKPIAE